MNDSARVWSGGSGTSTIFTFMMSSWNGTQGIERLLLKFKDTADLDNVNISIQHPGRMFAPEIIDSTFTVLRFNMISSPFIPESHISRGKSTVVTARYSVILMMNKPTYPCVPMEEEEGNHFDDCQEKFVREQVCCIKQNLIIDINYIIAGERARMRGAMAL